MGRAGQVQMELAVLRQLHLPQATPSVLGQNVCLHLQYNVETVLVLGLLNTS